MTPKTPETKVCRKCGIEKAYTKFPKARLKGGGTHEFLRSSPCFRCREAARLANPKSVIGETIVRKRSRYLAKASNVPAIVMRTARHSDKVHGRSGFDLDVEFVQQLLARGCVYCGGHSLRMTLDRIDNAMAHTKANVNPSCVRCNHIRGSMPYAAWLALVPAIKSAHEAGLFGDWWSDTRKNNKPVMPACTDATSHAPELP